MTKRVYIFTLMALLMPLAMAFSEERASDTGIRFGTVVVKSVRPRTSSATAAPVIPWSINYQGYLTDDAGNPVNDTLQLEFWIYDAAVGGTSLWNQWVNLPIEDGLFNIELVGVSPDVFAAGEPRWVELHVDAQVMTPRTQITSVGYAYRAFRTDTADYSSESDMVDGFNASAIPGPSDLFSLSYGDGQYVNEGQVDAINNPMILDGTIQRSDADPAFKAPYSDTADYALSAPVTPDNDWTITGDVLHPAADYGLGMRSSNVFYGAEDSTHINLGVACTTGISGQNYKYCTVGGGWSNEARGEGATVGGGAYNDADSTGSTVSGGSNNISRGVVAVVAGGQSNDASAIGAVIGGGVNNTASNNYATVAGGWNNSATGWQTALGGGWNNTASGNNSTVAGGNSNAATGGLAAICGGYADTVAGYCSFAAGREVRVTMTAGHTFAFGRNFTTSTPNAVIFHNSVDAIRVGIGVTAPTNYIDVAGGAYCDGTNWVNASSRECKKDIRGLVHEEYEEILEKLKETEVVRFRYKTQEGDELHIGVIAEDAPEEIVDRDRKAVPTGDAIGFLLAAVKAQQNEIELLKEEIAGLSE